MENRALVQSVRFDPVVRILTINLSTVKESKVL